MHILKIQSAFGALLIAMLVFAGFGIASPKQAFADGGDTSSEISALQAEVEATAQTYASASAKVADLQARIDENNTQSAEIQAQLPVQKEKAYNSLRSMYKMQNESSSLLAMLLTAEDIGDFLKTYQYLTDIQDKNLGEVEKLEVMQHQLDDAQGAIAVDMLSAQQEKDAAESAYSAAVSAREEAQQAALAEALAQAAAAQAALEAASASGEEGVSSLDGSPVITDGDVDWSQDRSSFVEQWGSRIDAYLSGSPLSGQGQTFAAAAWDYGVDPRWSPAISNTESSKGRYCFASCNAWGWGSSSWGSWEEAINAHVAGLAHGYGYTISVAAAQKYCPPNWENWYSRTLAEMNSI